MQLNFSQAKCHVHENQIAICVCFSIECKKRLVCQYCYADHTNHNHKIEHLEKSKKKIIKNLEMAYKIVEEFENILADIVKNAQELKKMEHSRSLESKQYLLNQLSLYDKICPQPRILIINILRKSIITHKINFRKLHKALLKHPNHLELLYYKVIVWYERSLQINPNCYSALKGKSDSLRGLQQYQKSIEVYNLAHKIDPSNKFLYWGKGKNYVLPLQPMLYKILKLYQESIECLKIALNIDPQFSQALLCSGKFNISAIYEIHYLQFYYQIFTRIRIISRIIEMV